LWLFFAFLKVGECNRDISTTALRKTAFSVSKYFLVRQLDQMFARRPI